MIKPTNFCNSVFSQTQNVNGYAKTRISSLVFSRTGLKPLEIRGINRMWEVFMNNVESLGFTLP